MAEFHLGLSSGLSGISRLFPSVGDVIGTAADFGNGSGRLCKVLWRSLEDLDDFLVLFPLGNVQRRLLLEVQSSARLGWLVRALQQDPDQFLATHSGRYVEGSVTVLQKITSIEFNSGFFWTFFQKLSWIKTQQILKLSQLFPQNSDFLLQNLDILKTQFFNKHKINFAYLSNVKLK